MSGVIRLVQGDTRPYVVVALSDINTGDPIDVSAAGTSVVLKFRAAGTTTVLLTRTGAKLPYTLLCDGTLDRGNATLGAGGRVVFQWQSGDLDQDPGRYEGEITINFADSTVQTVYDILNFSIREDM